MTWSGISGSGGYDCLACPSRAALPQCHETIEAADRGNVMHDFLCKVRGNPEARERYLAEVTDSETRATLAAVNIDAGLDGVEVRATEIAYALNVKDRTCRLIGERIPHRKYNEHLKACGEPELDWFEIPFTLDLEFWVPLLQCPGEGDYKTGQSVGPVAEHGQRKISSAGLMLYHGTDACVSRVIYVREDGSFDHDGHEFSIFDAYDVCDDMMAMLEAVKAARETVAAGKVPNVNADREKQCQFCAAFKWCPHWTNLAKAAQGILADLPELGMLTAEQAGAAMDKIKDILKVATKAEEDLRERALKERLIVDDTYEYSAKDQDGRQFEDTAALRGKLLQRLLTGGAPMSEEEAAEVMASFRKQGAPVSVVRRRKRLDVVKPDKKLKKVG